MKKAGREGGEKARKEESGGGRHGRLRGGVLRRQFWSPASTIGVVVCVAVVRVQRYKRQGAARPGR